MREFVVTLGVIGLWAHGAVAAAPVGDARLGRAAFAVCAACHQVGPSARNGFGPPLDGIVGRPAGSAPDYPYSTALKRAGIVWSADSLAAFIRDADRVVPGTKMRFSSFGYSTGQIDNLVAYLQTLSAKP